MEKYNLSPELKAAFDAAVELSTKLYHVIEAEQARYREMGCSIKEAATLTKELTTADTKCDMVIRHLTAYSKNVIEEQVFDEIGKHE